MSFDYSSYNLDDGDYGRTIKLQVGDIAEFTVKNLKTVDVNGDKSQALEGVDQTGDVTFWPKKRLLQQMRDQNVQPNDRIRITRGPDGSGHSDKFGSYTYHNYVLEVLERGSVADTVTSGTETTFSGLA